MDKIEELLTRGVQEVFIKGELDQALKSGKPLRVYYGVDPSGAAIHLGHTVLLRKLQILQELGHKTIFLIGDFTGMIGDPTNRAAARQPLTRKQVLSNAKTYKKQVSKFLNFSGKNSAEIRFNSEWNDKLKFKDVIELAGKFTVQQLLERDMFEKRLADGKPIGLHEFLYPVVQGYDAVMLEADLQIGGTDQTFNMLQGRNLSRALKNKTQMVLTCRLLVGTDGRKMGKSFDNVIAVEDRPNGMFGKVMSLKDELIKDYFILATRVPMEKINEILKLPNPRDQKLILAEEIVALYHGKTAGEKAREAFASQFSRGGLPADIKIFAIQAVKVSDALVEVKLAASKSEARRLIKQGGIDYGGHRLAADINLEPSAEPKLLRRGRNFVKIIKRK